MAHRTDNGKWRAQVRLPSGERISFEDRLQGVVNQWVIDTKAAIKNGTFRNPRDADMTVADWWPIWWEARTAGRRTLIDNEAIWRLHVKPRWGDVPLNSITKLAVLGWAKKLTAELAETADDPDRPDAGVRTVQKAVSLLSMLLQAAVDDDPPIIPRNPARGVRGALPPQVQRPPTYFTPAQVDAILAQLAEPWRTIVDFGTCTGLRWGELAGLPCRNVDIERRLIHVYVVSDHGRIREYPKSKKSRRSIRIPDHLVDTLDELTRGHRHNQKSKALVFRDEDHPDQPLNYYRFRRAWNTAVSTARTCGTACRPTPWKSCAKPEHQVPGYSIHAMRHTAASWLVMDGVDLYRVQKFMGHEDYQTTLRYAHLAPDANDHLTEVWNKLGRGRGTQVAPKRNTKRNGQPEKGP